LKRHLNQKPMGIIILSQSISDFKYKILKKILKLKLKFEFHILNIKNLEKLILLPL